MKEVQIIKRHDDGDLTIKENGKLKVVTTDGKVFEEKKKAGKNIFHEIKETFHNGIVRIVEHPARREKRESKRIVNRRDSKPYRRREMGYGVVKDRRGQHIPL